MKRAIQKKDTRWGEIKTMFLCEAVGKKFYDVDFHK